MSNDVRDLVVAKVILRDFTEINIFAYVIRRDFAEMNAVVQMVNFFRYTTSVQVESVRPVKLLKI